MVAQLLMIYSGTKPP